MKKNLLRLVVTFTTALALMLATLPVSASAAPPDGFVVTVTRGCDDNSATFSYNPLGGAVTGAEYALSNTSDNWATTGFANPTIGEIFVDAQHNFDKAVLYLSFSDGSRVMFEADTGTCGIYTMTPGGSSPGDPGDGGEEPTIPEGWEKTTPEMSVVFCVNGETVRTDLWGMEEYGVQPVLGSDGYAYIPWPDLAPEITRGECDGSEEPPVHPWLPSVPALTCEGVSFTIDNADAIEAEEQVRVTVYDSEYEVVSTIFVPLEVGQGVYEHLFDEALGDGTFTAGIAFGPDFAISAGSSEPVTCEAEDPGNGGTDPDPGDGDTDPDPGNGGTDPDPGDGDTDPDPGNGGTDPDEGTDDDSAPAVPAVTETPETDPVNGMPNTGDGSSLVGEASIVPVLASFAAVVVTGCWWWRLNFGGSKA